MKKYFFASMLFFCLQLLNAQQIKNVSKDTISIDENSKDIPFTIIEDVPVYPGCEKHNLEDRKYCMNRSMQKHIARKFNISIVDTLGLAQGKHKVIITFRNNKLGLPDSIKAVAPHPHLEKEAIRVINLLPKIIPGKYKGENVAVSYMLPISFNVDKPKPKRKRKNRS